MASTSSAPSAPQQQQQQQRGPAPPPPDRTEECSVCKDTFGGQETVLLECGHHFHAHCGQQWFLRQQPCRCPLCRADFLTKWFYDEQGTSMEESGEWLRIKQEAAERASDNALPEGVLLHLRDVLELMLPLAFPAPFPLFDNMVEVVTISLAHPPTLEFVHDNPLHRLVFDTFGRSNNGTRNHAGNDTDNRASRGVFGPDNVPMDFGFPTPYPQLPPSTRPGATTGRTHRRTVGATTAASASQTQTPAQTQRQDRRTYASRRHRRNLAALAARTPTTPPVTVDAALLAPPLPLPSLPSVAAPMLASPPMTTMPRLNPARRTVPGSRSRRSEGRRARQPYASPVPHSHSSLPAPQPAVSSTPAASASTAAPGQTATTSQASMHTRSEAKARQHQHAPCDRRCNAQAENEHTQNPRPLKRARDASPGSGSGFEGSEGSSAGPTRRNTRARNNRASRGSTDGSPANRRK